MYSTTECTRCDHVCYCCAAYDRVFFFIGLCLSCDRSELNHLHVAPFGNMVNTKEQICAKKSPRRGDSRPQARSPQKYASHALQNLNIAPLPGASKPRLRLSDWLRLLAVPKTGARMRPHARTRSPMETTSGSDGAHERHANNNERQPPRPLKTMRACRWWRRRLGNSPVQLRESPRPFSSGRHDDNIDDSKRRSWKLRFLSGPPTANPSTL